MTKQIHTLSIHDYRNIIRSQKHLNEVNTSFVCKNNKTLTYFKF